MPGASIWDRFSIDPRPAENARLRASDRDRDVVNDLLSAEGAMGFASANALQRIWRDISFAVRGRYINPAVAEESYGAALLGLEPEHTSLL